MADEIMKELWEIKDSIAQEHGYNIDALVAHFQMSRSTKDRKVVDLSARKKADEQGAPTDAGNRRR